MIIRFEIIFLAQAATCERERDDSYLVEIVSRLSNGFSSLKTMEFSVILPSYAHESNLEFVNNDCIVVYLCDFSFTKTWSVSVPPMNTME